MDIIIQPKKLRGKVHAIQSKSHAHRAMICAALAGEPELIQLERPSEDLLATKQAVEIFRGAGTADCRESGTTLRLLVPPAAALGLPVTFTGEGRLPRRPMEPLLSLLELHGARLSGRMLPFSLSGKLTSGCYSIPGNISSQYVSGLLLALPLLAGDSELILTTELESAGYVDMTLDCQKKFGVEIIKTKEGWQIPGDQEYLAPAEFFVEGDWSNAAFWLVATALGSQVRVLGLSDISLQKDREIASIIELEETEIDARHIPDLVPILAVLAAGTGGKITFIRNCGRLRHKESDRIASVTNMIRDLGGLIEVSGDDLAITGTGSLSGGKVDCEGDHRIAMAASIAATICKASVSILGAQAVSKSYPEFFQHYTQLGGEIHVL